MGYIYTFNDLNAFKMKRFDPKCSEQTLAIHQQHGGQNKVEFIEQAGLNELLHDIRATYHNIFIACRFLSLCQGAFNAIGDEGKG